MIKAVLFDIDGVLIDSLETALHFVGDILAHMGHRVPPRNELLTYMHFPLVQVLQRATGSKLTDALKLLPEITSKIHYRSDLLSEFPFTREMLEVLQKKYVLGLITSRKNDGLRRYFDFSKNEHLFSTTVTVEDVTHHKPHPEPLLLAAKRLKLKPSECVYIGDSHTDIEAGKAAGMKTILYGGKKHVHADARTLSFRKLPELIASL
ncbi:MAG: HAD family hydrolase [bacterium]|nr:HAD family hydrolase [bacterium]